MALFQPDWVSKWAVYKPDAVAVKDQASGRSLTYAELDRQGSALAAWLQASKGLQKGDRIAILSEFNLTYILLFVAAQKTGIILVPLNYRLTSSELDFLLQDADPAFVLFEEKYTALIQEAQSLAKIAHQAPLESLLYMAASHLPGPLAQQAVTLTEDDPVFILYTSGTTGFPKGALYTHGMLFWNSINTSMSLLLNTESRTINCMPPFHTGGWNVLLTPLLHHGGYICLVKKFEAGLILELMKSEKPSLLMAVPTMLKMIAEEATFAQADLSSLHYLIVGGEPMPIPLIETWHQKGIAIRQGYGMTEVGPNLTSLHQDDAIRKKGSIGFPNFYLETRIVKEDGEIAAPGESGELWLKGPVVMPAYWRNETATRSAFSGEWFRSGDQVVMDEEGYYYVVDRIKNMFVSGAENVYPAEIERILRIHPAVKEAVVIGIPDPKWGEVGHAFIVAQDQQPDPRQILAHCARQLAKYKVPKSMSFLPELPRNDTGKIDRKRLRWPVDG